ncbi:MAG: hypothetical protein IJU89_03340 [Alphaproteobacteria bacterium]|nr:hypothetical protein [Alphaproteobacteria bacterium]
MKKYFVLTSVLALAACGGGSGGGIVPIQTGNTTRSAVDPTAVTSNSNITSMASEILVANGHTPILARSGTVNKNGVTYNSYRLDDVNFRVATGANDAYIKFNMDDLGKIDSLVMNVGDITGTQHMDRNGDTNQFRGIVYEYVVLDAPDDQHMNDASLDDDETLVRLVVAPSGDITDYSVLSSAAANKCPAGKSCRWDRIDQAFRVSSQGSDFKYSDFGKLETANFGKTKGVTENNLATVTTPVERTETEWANVFDTNENHDFNPDDYDVFAGGYNINAVTHRPTETITFTGKAIGSVYATDSTNHPDAGLALQDNAATLEFNTATGKETLSMAFNNWYDVTVEKDNINSTNKIVFSNYTNSDTTHYAENTSTTMQEYMKFKNDTGSDITINNFTTTTGSADTAGNTMTQGLLDMNYYGIGSTEEATGIVRFKETANDSGTKFEHEFRAGYGMTPDAH